MNVKQQSVGTSERGIKKPEQIDWYKNESVSGDAPSLCFI